MSYYVRQIDGKLVMYERRPATEIGYEGPVVTLPPRMAETYLEALNATLEDEDLGAPTVRMDFSTRQQRPVLLMRWEGQTRQIVVDNEGGSKVIGRGSDLIEGNSGVIEWTTDLTGSLAALTDEFIRYTAEESRWPESIAEAVRRGLEPTELELDDAPVVENEKARGPRFVADVEITLLCPDGIDAVDDLIHATWQAGDDGDSTDATIWAKAIRKVED